MIFYNRFFATDFLEGYICSREEERNCDSYESTVEESLRSRMLCDDTIARPASTSVITFDSDHERSTSLVDFLKSAIHSKLEERASMIRELSVIITNLPFHLQLKPVECSACSFK